MAHVARELTREGFDLPLLIGGATTSKAHTAVKIAPGYNHSVVHVLDASRAVGVVGSLVNADLRADFAKKVRADYDQIRQTHQEKGAKSLWMLPRARANRFQSNWAEVNIPIPTFTGVKVVPQQPLDQLIDYIDWSPFFHTWELRGRYRTIFNDPVVGPKAKELYDDARALLSKIVDQRLFTANGVYGFFPANSVGDDIEIYRDDRRTAVLTTFHTLRQQSEKPQGQCSFALADFVAPKESGRADYIGAFAVTTGVGVDILCREFERDHDDYNSIMAKALADRLAEAFAEYLHKQAREAWGYGKEETLSSEDLIREKYRGIRPAPGYPACPDHTEKRLLFDLLSAEQHTGITLTESFAMWPAASVSGLYFAHPDARYFAVGKIGKDQVFDYQARKGMPLSVLERWLGPNLNYEPTGG
jgi:5-methyltetrahydrofolate--homocysteine methyltransferase